MTWVTDSNLVLIAVIIVVLLVLIGARIFYIITEYNELIGDKDIQLMQLYLDLRFMNRILTDSLKHSNSANFCNLLIDQIKNYYNLEKIIIIDSIKKVATSDSDTIRNAAIKFIQKDIESIFRMLSGHKLQQFNLKVGKKEYVLHISLLSVTTNSDGVVICIEAAPSLIRKNERLGLENSINLLKNRLFYE